MIKNTNRDFLPVLKGDRIDLMALFKNIWAGRKTVIAVFFVFVVLGLLIAIFSPVKYRSGSVLLPQSDEQQDLGSLGGLASLAGVNLSDMFGMVSGISPDLYPSIVGSYPFLIELVQAKFNFKDEPQGTSLFDQMAKEDNISKFKKYTIRLPWTVKEMLFPPQAVAFIDEDSEFRNLVVINKETASVLTKISNSIAVEVSTKTGLISVSVEHEDAYASAQIAQKLVDMLQVYVINYKTSQVRNDLEYVEARFIEKKKDFEEAQRQLFNYQDSHRNMVSERVDSRFQQLTDEYSLSRTVYQNLAQQLEQTKLAVKKETPVFTVIEPVKVPFEKYAPRRVVILFVYSFLGLLLGLFALYLKSVYNKMHDSWHNG